MENEQWPSKCQQSVGTTVERTDSLNNGNRDIPLDSTESIKSAGNSDPETINGTEVLNQGNSPRVTISETSKQLIFGILEQIKTLSPIEKRIFNLKYSSEISNVIDPFRQPLNPLGSRSEIYRTISWIKTHLEEDPDTSLPKQEVYDEYHRFCDENKFKPLSQADFGKAMKQVYPNVRARRLGTRGKSRYCYSGLRRCIKLKPPILPDLADKPMSTEAPFTYSSFQSAWLIIRDWAKQQLGREFTSLHELAIFLVLNYSICEGTEIAYKLTQADSQLKEESNGKIDSKHREMQMQLQRKIQQKNEINRERKRKNQSPKSDQKPSGKKARAQSVPNVETSPMLAVTTVPSECGTSSSSTSPTQGKPVCDKSLDYTQRTSLPEFTSFQKPTAERPHAAPGLRHHTIPEGGTLVGKVPIAKLQTQHQLPHSVKKQAKNTKYKAIQPKLELCDIASYNCQPNCADDNRSQDVHDIDRFKEKKYSDDDCDGPDFPLPRERLNSISNVEKDAMDEYLGTNNSQHEEELSKYFSNNNIQNDLTDDTTKISHLRHILQQNGIVDSKNPIMEKINMMQDKFVNPVVQHIPLPNPNQFINTVPPTLPNVIGQARRRVSFDTRGHDDPVPPSPNTRRKHFSFTPISPGPQSPNSLQSKCSSTNASPFVSPRNTPIPRTKNNTHQNAGIMLPTGCKPIKVKKELTIDLPDSRDNFRQFIGKDCMPMSAPPSPMLQKLLNSKGPYKPSYVQSQNLNIRHDTSAEVSQLLTNQIPNDLSEMAYRSQSVPVNQMMIKNSYPIDNQFIAQLPKQNDFNEVDPIPESECTQVNQIIDALKETPCDNDKINNMLCNMELSASNQSLPEYGLHFVNNNLEIPEFPTSLPYNNHLQNPCPRNIGRSQSIDVISFEPKCNPSRSVPSTPLPFKQILKPVLISSSSRSYPSTPMNTSTDNFNYNININGDCLLNGQPIRSDELAQSLNFMQGYSEMNGDNNLEGHEFAVENDNSIMDDNCVLIEQNYNTNIN